MCKITKKFIIISDILQLNLKLEEWNLKIDGVFQTCFSVLDTLCKCYLWTSPTCFSSTTIIKGIVFLRRGRVTNEGHGMAGSTWIMGISRDPVNVAWPISLWDLCHSLACLPACAWRDHFFFDSYGISSHMSQAFLPAQTNPHSTRSIWTHSRLAPRCGFEQKVKLFF